MSKLSQGYGHPVARRGTAIALPPTEWPHFNAAYGQYYYVRPVASRLQGAGQRARRAGGAGELRLVAGDRRTWSGRRVGPGDALVIQGAGGLGINAVAVAKERGVTQVIVIDGIESRLALATEFGADVTIDLNEFQTPTARVATRARADAKAKGPTP